MNVNKLFTYFLIMVLLAGFVLAEKDVFSLDEESAGNLYLTNNDVSINSNLYGDLFSVSNRIDINELVQDDVNAIAGKFLLEGTIGSDLRLVSSLVVLDGTVFGETMILGNYVNITDNAALGEDVRINANTVIIDGTLKQNLNVKAEKVIINGVVEGDAVIQSSVLEFGPDARVMGDFSSTRSIDGMSSKIDGIITKMDRKENLDDFTSITFQKIGLFLTLFLIGVVLVLASRKFTDRAVNKMGQRFFLSLLLGLLVIVIAPFVAILLLITVVGIPVALIIGLVYVLALILAFGMMSIFSGKLCIRLFRKKRRTLWVELLIGSLFLALISFIPVVFLILVILFLFVSIGAMVLAAFGKDKKK